MVENSKLPTLSLTFSDDTSSSEWCLVRKCVSIKKLVLIWKGKYYNHLDHLVQSIGRFNKNLEDIEIQFHRPSRESQSCFKVSLSTWIGNSYLYGLYRSKGIVSRTWKGQISYDRRNENWAPSQSNLTLFDPEFDFVPENVERITQLVAKKSFRMVDHLLNLKRVEITCCETFTIPEIQRLFTLPNVSQSDYQSIINNNLIKN